jgi:hypothetical protein
MELIYYYIETKTKSESERKTYIGGAVCTNVHFDHFQELVKEQNGEISMKMEIPKSLFDYIQYMGNKLEAKVIESNEVEFRDFNLKRF